MHPTCLIGCGLVGHYHASRRYEVRNAESRGAPAVTRTRSMLQSRNAEKQRKTMAQRFGNCPCSSSSVAPSSAAGASESRSLLTDASSAPVSPPLPSACGSWPSRPRRLRGGVSGSTSVPRSARVLALPPARTRGEPPVPPRRWNGGAGQESGSRWRSMAAEGGGRAGFCRRARAGGEQAPHAKLPVVAEEIFFPLLLFSRAVPRGGGDRPSARARAGCD